MNKTKSILAVIMVMIVTLIGFSACKNKCEKDGEKCEKASCCKDEKCCDKCSGECTAENKYYNKCKVGEEKACCKKDKEACSKDGAKMDTTTAKACCKKDADKNSSTAAMYVCPMHKNITSDKPGKCSECNMDLEKK